MFKKSLKIFLPIMLIVALCVPVSFMFSGCNRGSGKVDIAVTTRPAYDWVKTILGDNSNLTVGRITCRGTTIQGMARATSSPLLIYTGGASEGWVLGALNNRPNNLKWIRLMDEPIWWEFESTEDCCPDTLKQDENVWMSLLNAKIFVDVILTEIIKLDPSNAGVYAANAANFQGDLQDLHDDFVQELGLPASRPNNRLIVADVNQFRYWGRDYEIGTLAAFTGGGGCSGGTLADFATRARMIEALDDHENSIRHVLWITANNQQLARTMIDQSERRLELSTRQILCPQLNNTDYMTTMRNNLEILKEILGVSGE